jgi:large subunit ribosomal protein L10
MSKQVKEVIMREYTSRIADDAGEFGDVMLIDIRAVKGTDTTKLRATLRKKDIRITMVRNSLARKVLKGTNLDSMADMLEGSTAIAYGGQSVVEVAREIIAAVEKLPKVELKGAILDGILFKGKAGVTELSKFPTKDEAIGQIVTLMVSPGKKLVGQIQGPGSALAGIIKSIEEKLEKGEAITATA